MSKFLLCSAVSALLFSAVGCGGSGSDSDGMTPEQQTAHDQAASVNDTGGAKK
jgi:hypothetical protein